MNFLTDVIEHCDKERLASAVLGVGKLVLELIATDVEKGRAGLSVSYHPSLNPFTPFIRILQPPTLHFLSDCHVFHAFYRNWIFPFSAFWDAQQTGISFQSVTNSLVRTFITGFLIFSLECPQVF